MTAEAGQQPVSLAVRSIKWSAMSEVVVRVAPPFVSLVLARILTPGDFGVIAAAMAVIAFAQMFSDAGLSKALIQVNQGPESADTAFWTNFALGGLFYGVLLVGAPWLASIAGSPGSTAVIRVLGCQIVLGSLASVQQALFVRHFGFRQLFWIRLCTALLPGLVAVPAALAGYGAWSLVVGALAGQAANAVLLWTFSFWRPGLSYSASQARALLPFGLWVTAEGVVAWIMTWADVLIVGRMLGLHELGVYRTAWLFVNTVFGLTLNPLLLVAYPTFCRLQTDAEALRAAFHRANTLIAAAALPTGCGLALVGPDLADLLFGARWQGLGLALRVLGAALALAWLIGINGEAYRSVGRPDVTTKLNLVALGYYLPSYYFAAQHGFVVFLEVRLLLVLLTIPLHVLACHWTLHVRLGYLWHDAKKPLGATAAMIGALTFVRFVSDYWRWPAAPGVLPLLVTTGAAVYILTLWAVDRPLVLRTTSLLRRAIES